MAKTYRAMQQWNHWLTQFLGHRLLEAEKKFLLSALVDYFGKHVLLVGVPHQHDLLKTSVITNQILLTPLLCKDKHSKMIEGDPMELPVLSGSIDLVILPHSLEYIDNPRKLLAEACRIIKPEGHIVILGFNPLSLWGVKKMITKNQVIPWSTHFIQARTVKKWLNLADFELVKQRTFLFRPPMHHHFYHKLKLLEWFGDKCYSPFGGVYALIAKAKVIPFTPIRMRWQQKLSGIHATIPRPSMREF